MTTPGAKGAGRRDAYRAAGVDVAAGDRAVDLMRAHVESTRRPEVVGGLGGFGGAIAIPAGYREPLLVASTDGVGTKTAIAASLERFDTIGIDLVAMCADDVVCCGAEPLAFLDYVAVGQVVPESVAELVGSVAAGCRDAGCALVGGETAEHPELMSEDDASTCRAAASASSSAPTSSTGRRSRAGDAIVGLAVVRAPCQRLLAGPRAASPSGTSTSTEPYQARLRRSLGRRRDGRGAGGRAERGDGDARGDPADADPDLRPVGPGGTGRGPGDRARTSTASPTSPAAACRATCRARCRTAWRPGSTRRAGRCRRSCACSGPSAGWTTRSCARRSTAGSGWSSCCRRPRSRPRSGVFEADGIPAVVVGEVVDAADSRRLRYVEGPLEGRA